MLLNLFHHRKIIAVLSFFIISVSPVYADPAILDPKFNIEKVVTGLNFPVQMEFVGGKARR